MAKKRKVAKKRTTAKKRRVAKKKPAAKKTVGKTVMAKMTCPECKHSQMLGKKGSMGSPNYKCTGCKKNIKAKDCCVYCDYSNKPCPCCK
jgi:transposase-like protein